MGRSREEAFEDYNLFWQTIYADDLTRIQQSLLNTYIERKSKPSHRIIRPRRTMRWIAAHISPCLTPSGSLSYAGIFQDTTDYKLIAAAET